MAVRRDLDFNMRCIRYMLCVANIMFMLVGLLFISIGYTITAIYNNFTEFMEQHYFSPATLAITVGFFIFLISMFGCVGAYKQSTFLVNLFAYLLGIVLILEIAVCIAAYAMRSNMKSSIAYNMQNAMENYNLPCNAYTWNATQYNLQCCGIRSKEEWNVYSNRSDFPLTTVQLFTNETLKVPTTCCAHEDCSSPSFLYSSGCLNRVTYIISQCAVLLGVGALCVSFIQILGIIFANMLAKSIRRLKTQMLVDKEERRRKFYQEVLKNEERKPAAFVIATEEPSA